MRHTKTLFLLILLSSSYCISAQKVYRQNVKLNLVSLPLGILYGQYERIITPRFTFHIGAGISAKKEIPQFTRNAFESFIRSQVRGADPEGMKTVFAKLRYQTFIITPEMRYYLSGKDGAPNGLYLGAFLRYSHHIGQTMYPYTRVSDDTYSEFDGNMKSSSWGGGLDIGYQWIIKERFNIDLTFLGIGANWSKVHMHIYSDSMTDDDKNEIISELHGHYTLGNIFSLEAKAGHNYVDAIYTGLLPIFRFGLAVGYTF